MSKSVIPFTNDAFGEIRGIMIDGNPYFVGKDVATALGYKDPKNALKTHVRDKHKRRGQITTPFGKQTMTLISEAGLYSLIMRSNLPKAEDFQDWVVEEVLPAIRKTGSYVADKQYLKWVETRAHVKITRRTETDEIKLFIEYAANQGCKWLPKKFYSRLSVWANICAGISVKGGRDDATTHQLNIIDLIEGDVIKNVLREGREKGLHWTQILRQVKERINSFLQVTFRSQRLQLGE